MIFASWAMSPSFARSSEFGAAAKAHENEEIGRLLTLVLVELSPCLPPHAASANAQATANAEPSVRHARARAGAAPTESARDKWEGCIPGPSRLPRQLGGGVDQLDRVRMGRSIKHARGGSRLDDLSAVEDDDPVCHLTHDRQVVRDE